MIPDAGDNVRRVRSPVFQEIDVHESSFSFLETMAARTSYLRKQFPSVRWTSGRVRVMKEVEIRKQVDHLLGRKIGSAKLRPDHSDQNDWTLVPQNRSDFCLACVVTLGSLAEVEPISLLFRKWNDTPCTLV